MRREAVDRFFRVLVRPPRAEPAGTAQRGGTGPIRQ